MSLYDYEVSQQLSAEYHSFYALIMAAMRQADSDNAEALRSAFPDTWRELQARYNAHGGVLNSDTGSCQRFDGLPDNDRS
jgi:hypothetical protein